MHYIFWPEDYLPGKTDCYVANESIASNVDINEVWKHLIHLSLWSSMNSALNSTVIHGNTRTILQLGDSFEFKVGDTLVNAEVVEYDDTVEGIFRLAWHGLVKDNGVVVVDAHCAFLVESLSENRTRVVMQESLKGTAAKKLASMTQNPSLHANQNWVNGLIRSGL